MDHQPNDPVIDEIREIRHRISASFDHDPVRLVAYFIELQKEHADRLLQPTKSPVGKDQSAA